MLWAVQLFWIAVWVLRGEGALALRALTLPAPLAKTAAQRSAIGPLLVVLVGDPNVVWWAGLVSEGGQCPPYGSSSSSMS